MNQIKIFDTTLRDGEQSPGCSMNLKEKIEVAKCLERLKVDVIEAGFAISSPGDFESVKTIAETVRDCSVASLARATQKDIDCAWEAVKNAADPRIHVFLATSPLHMEYKLKMTPEQVLARTAEMVKYAKQYTSNIEFSCEDATRSDTDFLIQVVNAAVKNGATVINLPDTVGYTTPDEMRKLIEDVMAGVENSDKVEFSVHCHNDLGMAVANSLAGVLGGARQIECTINGLGERAGNTAMEEVVMAMRTRPDIFGDTPCRIDTTQIARASKTVYNIIGQSAPLTKPIVGVNAFRHESGIHQHGVMANVKTYEIMTPESVGVKKTELVLGKHSGQHAFAQRLVQLGYTVDKALESKLFADFKVLADRKKTIEDRDIVALVEVATGHVAGEDDWKLKNYVVSSGNRMYSTACVTLEKGRKEVTESAYGTGPVFASIRAVEKIVGHAFSLLDYQINAATEGRDALGEVKVKISDASGVYRGRGVSTDIIEGSVLATLDAVNRMLDAKTTSLGSGAASKVQQTFENPEADMLAGHTDR